VPFTDANGVSLHYELAGVRGPSVVLLHENTDMKITANGITINYQIDGPDEISERGITCGRYAISAGSAAPRAVRSALQTTGQTTIPSAKPCNFQSARPFRG
jgi:hypothetical protein